MPILENKCICNRKFISTPLFVAQKITITALFVDVHKNEIISIIKSLSSDKISGVDNIYIKILKSYIAHVIN